MDDQVMDDQVMDDQAMDDQLMDDQVMEDQVMDDTAWEASLATDPPAKSIFFSDSSLADDIVAASESGASC
jgi:hypothetical protein